jgi:hypothetical protein
MLQQQFGAINWWLMRPEQKWKTRLNCGYAMPVTAAVVGKRGATMLLPDVIVTLSNSFSSAARPAATELMSDRLLCFVTSLFVVVKRKFCPVVVV